MDHVLSILISVLLTFWTIAISLHIRDVRDALNDADDILNKMCRIPRFHVGTHNGPRTVWFHMRDLCDLYQLHYVLSRFGFAHSTDIYIAFEQYIVERLHGKDLKDITTFEMKHILDNCDMTSIDNLKKFHSTGIAAILLHCGWYILFGHKRLKTKINGIVNIR